MASELEVGKLKVAASDGAGGLVHENASGIKVGTDSNTTTGYIGTISNHPLKLIANNDGKITVATSGLCTFSNGITVNGAVGSFANGIYFSSQTGAASPASTSTSVLNHYEEGTWTPVYAAAADSSGTWNTTLTGSYTRIGDLVTVSMKITGTAMDFSTVNGYRGYTGLPFTPALDCAGSYNTIHAASTKGTAAIFVSGSSLYLYPSKTGTGTTVIFATVTYKV